MLRFSFGSKDCLIEWLHRDNFVQAHILAAEAIQKHDSLVVSEMLIFFCTPSILYSVAR